MKRVIYMFIMFTAIMIAGCQKNKFCTEIPSGYYEATFITKNSVPIQSVLFLSKIDDHTFVINASGDTQFGPFVKRNQCNLGGTIEGMDCIGEIKRKNDLYFIEGSYSTLVNLSGLGNPNQSFTAIHGEFELIQQE